MLRAIYFVSKEILACSANFAAKPPSTIDISYGGSQQDLGPIDQLNNLPKKKLHDLEWNIVAFDPVSSITLCANTILEVSAISF